MERGQQHREKNNEEYQKGLPSRPPKIAGLESLGASQPEEGQVHKEYHQNQHWNQSTPEDEKPDRANTHNTTNAQHLQVQADDLYKDQDASKRFPPINLKAPQHRKDLHHYEKLYQARSYHQQGA